MNSSEVLLPPLSPEESLVRSRFLKDFCDLLEKYDLTMRFDDSPHDSPRFAFLSRDKEWLLLKRDWVANSVIVDASDIPRDDYW